MEGLDESTYNNINNLVHDFYDGDTLSIDKQKDLIYDTTTELIDNMIYSGLTECAYTSRVVFDVKTKGVFVYFAAYDDGNKGNNHPSSEH